MAKVSMLYALLFIVSMVLCMGAICAGAKSGMTRPMKARPDIATIMRKAADSGSLDVYIPAGTYTVGPNAIKLPDCMSIHGDGDATLLKLAAGTGNAFILGKSSSISRLRIDGAKGKSGGVSDGVIMLNPGADCTVVDSASFAGCTRTCIVTDHADDLIIRNCKFTDIFQAISIQFSSGIRIQDNNVVNAKSHGIQFWGNWKWQDKDCSNIIITGNYVKDGGGGGIWGTGADHVIASGNIVDGATDVGIDLEWCDDSVISDNVVSNFENGGISLFFACRGVSITGNTINNNRPIANPKAQWWSRAGIWLTYPNTEVFSGDTGHRDVTISGNTITCAEGDRRGIWVGASADNITIGNNTINRGGIWSGGGLSPMKQIDDNTTIKL